MSLQARRVFRLALATAVALVLAYALGFTFAFFAPLFAFMFTLTPAPPIGSGKLLVVVIMVAVTTGIGLLLVPLQMHYPTTAVLVVVLGIYMSFYLTVLKQQAALGAFVAIGFTVISAAALYDFVLGQALVESFLSSIVIAIISQWLVYPFFPEDPPMDEPTAPAGTELSAAEASESNWIAIRGTLIVLPVYLLALNNPSMYIAAIMKAVTLGQQTSHIDTANAGRELLGSTFIAACLAIAIWTVLSILPNLWMYFLLMLLAGLFVASKAYGVLPSRYPPSFWSNAMTTMLILLGPAIADLGTGKDVYMASLVRLALFVAVTLYAWWTVALLDGWLKRRQRRKALVAKENA